MQESNRYVPEKCALIEGDFGKSSFYLAYFKKTMTPENAFDSVRQDVDIQKSSFTGEIKEYLVMTPLGSRRFAVY